jgi:hypothetical protein
MEIGVSLSRHGLRGAGGCWIELVRAGARKVLWAMCLAMGAGVAFGIAHLLRIFDLYPIVGISVFVVSFLLTPFLYVGGVWELTIPDPRGLGERDSIVSRRAARIAPILFCVQAFIDAISADNPSNIPAGLLIAIAFAGITWAVGWFALLHYLQKLAWRIPDMDLSRKAGILKFALSGSWVVMLAGVWPPLHGACLFWLTLPFAFVSGCMFVGLLAALSSRLRYELLSTVARAPETCGPGGNR